jgi:hypothetical protein
VQNYASEEPVVEAIPEPGEMCCIVLRRCSGRLDLDSDDAIAGELDHQVDLVPAVLLTHVKYPWPPGARRQLRPELRRNEGVEHAADQVTVTHHGPDVDTERRAHQRRVDEVSLRCLHQTREPVRQPRGHDVEHEQVGQEPVIGSRGLPVDVRGFVDRRIGDDARRIQRDNLEVPRHPHRSRPNISTASRVST